MYIRNQHELVADAFEKGYTLSDMKESFFQLTRTFVQRNMSLLVEEEVPEKIILIGTYSSLSKRTLALFVTIPYLNKRLFQAFKTVLHPDVLKLMDILVYEESMSQVEIEKQLGFKVYESLGGGSSYEKRVIKPEFRFFRNVNIHSYSTLRPADYSLYIEPSVRRIISIYYNDSKGKALNPVETLPNDLNLTIYDKVEMDILLELPRLLAYAQQDNIKVSGKGKPAISTLGKMQRKLNLAEFYPAAPEKSLHLMRTNLLAGLITLIGKGTSSAEPALFIKTLIQSYYANGYVTLHKLLTYLKGTGYVDEYYLENITPHFAHLLSQLPENEWISVDNVIKYLKFNFIDVRPIKEYIARNKLYYEYDAVVQYERYAYRESKHYIDNKRYDAAITKPTIKGTFFLFAAFGLLDIAFEPVDTSIIGQTCDSPYDGLQYIRLTKLGAYVAGQQTEYQAPEAVQKSTIELSPDSLTIISDKNDPTAAIVLEPYTEKVTPNRFKTDFSIFLNGISNKQELADKINLFKQSVSDDLPPNWELFFKELEKKIDPLAKVSNLVIYKIPEDSPDLIQLIARDSKLKNICYKAEGYHILVEKKKLPQFKSRLREFGYLMSK